MSSETPKFLTIEAGRAKPITGEIFGASVSFYFFLLGEMF